jgi:hypothetical protein
VKRQQANQPPLLDGDLCAYCGGLASTKDHTPPRNLLRSPLPNHTITVPACRECNEGYSFDEALFKVVLAFSSEHPELVAARAADGSVGRALERDRRLREIYERSLDGNRLILAGDLLDRISRVLFKTTQGLYHALYDRLVPAGKLRLVCFQQSRQYSLDSLVAEFRPEQVLDITDEPLPEITPSGWARKGQVALLTMTMTPVGGGAPIEVPRVFWFKQETPVEWVQYQEGVFKFGFVGTPEHDCICAIELWESLIVGIRAPWPSGRGSLRRGRRNPFSRERRP